MKQQTYILLTADDGMVLTNGELYGKMIALGNGDSPDNYHEITEAEYKKMREEAESEATDDA